MKERSGPKPTDLLADEQNTVDHVSRVQRLEAQIAADLSSSESAKTFDEAAQLIFSAALGRERLLAEHVKQIDRKAYAASPDVRAKEDAKRDAINEACIEFTNDVIRDRVIPATDRLYAIEGSPSAAERCCADDASHEARISRDSSRFNQLSPEEAMRLGWDHINDPAWLKQMLPHYRTARTLGLEKRKPYWTHFIGQLNEFIEQAEAGCESAWTIRQRLADEMVESRKAGLRGFLQLLSIHSPSDPVFKQLATQVLHDFDTTWL